MNNKKLGTEFERYACQILAEHGFWVHFITPDARGAQPFDIIAVRDGEALAIDCKTSARPIFPISRLEDNQINAFEKWLACGNEHAGLLVKWDGMIFFLKYKELKWKQKIDLRDKDRWEYDFGENHENYY